MDAEGILDHLLAVLAGQVLGHAGLEIVARAGVLAPCCHHDHLVRRLDLGGHLGQPELHGLMPGDGLAERLALLGVGDGELEGPQRDAAAAGGHVDPAHLDPVHHLVEAPAGAAAEDPVAGTERSKSSRWCRRPCSPSSRFAGDGEAGDRRSPKPGSFSIRNVVMFL